MNQLEHFSLPGLGEQGDLNHLNRKLEKLSAVQRVEWALQHLPGNHVLTSSFGIQAALMLHMATRIVPDITVVLVDTGHLFPETSEFVDQLTERLGLNLRIYRAHLSPALQEKYYGRLWEQGLSGLKQYNRINKVEPLKRAFRELDVGSWLVGLRRQQSESRASLAPVRIQDGRYKVHPVFDWNSRDVYRYLRQHHLPYHPLWEKGYVSVGDMHTSRPLEAGMREEDTRFFGLKRECGIHE